VLAAVGVGTGVYILATVPPTDATPYPKCMLHQTTGLHCPGCGLTRSVHAALNGRFEQAFAYNALAVVILPYLGVSLVRSLWSWLWGTPLRPSRLPAGVRKWMPLTIGVVMCLFWVLRNIPVYPFTLLAPHEISP
jgi:hypothetical protein